MSTQVKNLTAAVTVTRDSLQLLISGVLAVTRFLCAWGSSKIFQEIGLYVE